MEILGVFTVSPERGLSLPPGVRRALRLLPGDKVVIEVEGRTARLSKITEKRFSDVLRRAVSLEATGGFPPPPVTSGSLPPREGVASP